MPSIARTLALMLVAISPTAASAQLASRDAPANSLETPSLEHRPRGSAFDSPSDVVARGGPEDSAAAGVRAVGAAGTEAGKHQAHDQDKPPSAAKASPSLALPPRPTNGKKGAAAASDPKRASGWPSLANAAGSLAIVLGLLLAVVWLLRRTAPKGAAALPKEAFEVFGRATLTARQHVQLIRCGNKLLLVALTVGGAETLTEITDPDEVDRLAGLCLSSQPNSSTSVFRGLLEQFHGESAPVGFLGDGGRTKARAREDLDV